MDTLWTLWTHSQMQVSTLRVAGYLGCSWGAQRFRHSALEAGIIFWVQSYTIPCTKMKIYLKKKTAKKNPPLSCTHSTDKPGLATPKIESLRRYFYTKTFLVTLLTITWFPDFHLCLASCLCIAVQFAVSLQLGFCLAVHPWDNF